MKSNKKNILKRILIFFLISFIVYRVLLSTDYLVSVTQDKPYDDTQVSILQQQDVQQQQKLPDEGSALVKKIFEEIYAKRIWGLQGDGSGPGSTTEYTTTVRNILYAVIRKYNIMSLLDAPCGSFLWMSQLMANVSLEKPDFRYHGIDIVGPVIGNLTIKHTTMAPKWLFSLVDFTAQPLPDSYELIFSRDSMQHLPLMKVVDFLENIAHTNGIKYFLAQSYIKSTYRNRDIKIGDYSPVDLFKAPFNFNKFIEQFSENDSDGKHLVLIDVENYLKYIDFVDMKKRVQAYIAS